MQTLRLLLSLAALLGLVACAAVPGNELGTQPVRSPVTVADENAVLPIAIYDPWEGFNRGAYRFNTEFDRYVFLPVLRGYEYVTPSPVQLAVSNFFNNLGEIR